MHHFFKSKTVALCLNVLLCVVATPKVWAQGAPPNTSSTKETAPYSRYGLGEELSGANIYLRGQGYLNATGSEPFACNPDNPASYAWLKLTTFELSGEARSRKILTNVGDYKTGTFTPAYMNVGLPFGKYYGLLAGFRPVARTFYNYLDTQRIPGIGDAAVSYNGEGSLSEAYFGGAFRYKSFSIGANAGFQFGDYVYLNQLVPLSNDTGALASIYNRRNVVNGWHYKLGALYAAKLKKGWYLRLAGTADLQHNLKVVSSEYWSTYRPYELASTEDTSFLVKDTRGKAVMPLRLSFGAQLLITDQWKIGVNTFYDDWSKYELLGNKDSIANKAMRYALGLEFTPDASDIYNYFSRVSYRLGFTWGTDKVKLNNTQLKYWAVTAGFSLPFRRFNDRIHTSFEYGSRGTLNNGLIKENYFRFGMGFSLNDRWFVKPKYD